VSGPQEEVLNFFNCNETLNHRLQAIVDAAVFHHYIFWLLCYGNGLWFLHFKQLRILGQLTPHQLHHFCLLICHQEVARQMLLLVGFKFELLFNSCHFCFTYRYLAHFAPLFEVKQLLFISDCIVIEPFHRGLKIFEKSQLLEMHILLSVILFQWFNLDFS